MLSSSEFLKQYRDGGSHAGVLIVVFLASFRPIGQSVGIPAVYRAAEHLETLITELARTDSLVGKLSAWTYAVFVPSASLEDGTRFVDAIRMAGESQQFDLAAGDSEPIHVAAGVVDVPRPNTDIIQSVRDAARLAEQDQQRFPSDWRYPIVLPGLDEAEE